MKDFKLQSVLNYRKILEENIQKNLANLNKDLCDENEILEKIIYELEIYKIKLQNKSKNGVKLSDILFYFNSIEYLADTKRKQKKKISKIENEIKFKKTELLNARTNKKMIEELKNKSVREWNININKKEQKYLDDIGITIYNKKIKR